MIIRFSREQESKKFRVSMAKTPSESRIPTLGSRIPIPGKLRFLPKINLRNTKQEVAPPDPPPPLVVEQPLNATVNVPQPVNTPVNIPQAHNVAVSLAQHCTNKNSTVVLKSPTCNLNTTVVTSRSPANPLNSTDIIPSTTPNVQPNYAKNDNTVVLNSHCELDTAVVKPRSPPRLLNSTVSIPQARACVNNDNTVVLKPAACNLDSTVVKARSPVGSAPVAGYNLNNTVVKARSPLGPEPVADETFLKHDATADRSMVIVHDITADDIGRTVCVANTQTGVLRYFGEVQFSAGAWCGVELDNPIGKHDGCVQGVRYFQCRPNCGIMAPVANVIRCADSSGPHSLLDTQAEQDLADQINPGSVSSGQRKRVSCILSCNWNKKPFSMSDTLSFSVNNLSPSLSKKSTPLADPNDSETSMQKSPEVADTPFSKYANSTKINCSPGHSPTDSRSFGKENSFEYDESLGILTPSQMLEFSAFVESSKTPSSEDLKSLLSSKQSDKTLSNSRTSSSENLGALPEDGFKLPAPTSMEAGASLAKEFSELEVNVKSLDNQVKLSSEISLSSPNAVESSAIDISLGIIGDEVLMQSNQFSSMIETAADLVLDLGHRDRNFEDFKSVSRSDETPSPEDLPLDPIGSVKCVDVDIFDNQNSESETKPGIPSAATKINTFVSNGKSLENALKLVSIGQSDVSLSSPNAVESSAVDFSLGIIDDEVLTRSNQFSSKLDIAPNADLSLDFITGEGKYDDFKSVSRSDQTPSPEDLPLDPIDTIDPIKSVEMDLFENPLSNPSTDSDTKTDVSKSTAAIKTNSFITSVTSITSLDTGYQGDGEMSRPASRGADHSPIAHKPNNPALANLHWQRAINRRQDPMTDSDFFTESDADVHDDNTAARGDRRAQVIDGTLYGANAQAGGAHDIYIANQEEMESSGVFTDMELNARTEDFSDGERNRMDMTKEDKSPSDVSTKSISENSQAIIVKPDLDATITNEPKSISPIQEMNETVGNEKFQSPSRTRTPSPKEDKPNKKLKMPERSTVAKVKTPVKAKPPEVGNQENRRCAKKTVNRWDAVMKKISKGQTENTKIRLKEVKSKVASTIMASNKSEKTPLTEVSPTSKTKTRRIRARAEPLVRPKSNSRTTSSVHSSVSDVSVGIASQKQPTSHPAVTRVSKKRDNTVGRCTPTVTEVLTPTGHKPTPLSTARPNPVNAHRPTRELKKAPAISTTAASDAKPLGDRRTPTRRTVGATITHKPAPHKDQSRVTGTAPHKGGSPARTQALQERTQLLNTYLPQIQHSAKGVEALGVLIQYLVFNLDAFRTPSLKRELQQIKSQWLRDKLELEETRMGYRRLEDLISEQKILSAQTLEEERVRFRSEISELFERQRKEISDLTEKYEKEKFELERRLEEQNAELKTQLDAEISNREREIELRIETYATEQRYKVQELEGEKERLRQEHRIALEILREENESIREQLDEKTFLIEDLNELRFRNEKLKKEFSDKEKLLEEKLILAEDEIAVLKEENKKILETFKSDTKDNKLQAALGRCTQLQDEVESLRTVLDLKLAELSELRRAHGELSQAADELPAALLRAQTLQARVEDLEIQLERKTEIEIQLTKENKRLQESYNQETKQKMRIALHNEELQWKLKQNSEVVNAILQGQTPSRKSLHGSNQSLSEDVPYRNTSGGSSGCGGYLSRSLHTSSFNEKHHGTSPHLLERTLSFREKGSSISRKSDSPRDYLELEYSPPSSPKVKGVVEKSDSVSWVLDMDESPEVMASRMVRRAGSFRNVTPPKSTPTKSPASKRPRTKANNLSLSASAGAIVSPESTSSSVCAGSAGCGTPSPGGVGAGVSNDNRHRSKSVSLREPDNGCHPGEYLSNSWHYSLRTSTPTKSGLETIRSGTKLENNPDLEHDSDVALSLPALPSEIIRKKEVAKPDSLPSLPSGDLLLLQSAFPKNSAGEAMISESNSEDECSSSTSERSPSATDSDTSEEQTAGSTDPCGDKHSKMQYDLFLMTESTTNSEVMDCSWSEELDV